MPSAQELRKRRKDRIKNREAQADGDSPGLVDIPSDAPPVDAPAAFDVLHLWVAAGVGVCDNPSALSDEEFL